MKHNKYRNIGVIFESLIHYAMKLISEGRVDRATKIMKVIRENFINKTSISECYNIYSQLLYSEAINYYHASKFYSRLIKEHNKLNHNIINMEISSLFSLLREDFNVKEIMNTKIPNYKLFSSFRIASAQDNNYLSSKDFMVVETVILEHLTNNNELKKLKENNIISNSKTRTELNTDRLANVIAFKNFEKKYKNELTEEQKECLIKFYSSDDKTFKNWVDKKVKFLMDEISDKSIKIENENTSNKLNLISEKLSKIISVEKIEADGFTDLMMSFKLYDYLKYV